MQAYRRLQWFFVGLIGVYLVIGYTTWALRMPEIFPIYSWDLFSYTPTEIKTDYSLRIVKINGQPLQPPVYFEQGRRWFSKANTIEASVVIQALGQAAKEGDPKRVTDVRVSLEPLFLAGAGRVEYDVVERRYNPLQRWQNGIFLEETTLATLTTQDGLR